MAERTRGLILPGVPEIEVLWRRSPRARRLSLRVSRLDGRVTLSAPVRVREAEAMAFLLTRAEWVRRHVETALPATGVVDGATIPVEGRACRVLAAPGQRAALAPGEVRVRPGRPAGPQAAALLKGLARDRLDPAARRHASVIGREVTLLALRDTRSRWGSCTAAGRLMFSWRLAMAPPAVLDYVAAHEVAHLREMHHGPAFWALVEELCPDWRRHRDWLRGEGTALHRYRFDAG